MQHETNRCPWANVSQQNQDYHDKEWAIPVYDDCILFENLTLEGAQAGLSWSTILKKRQGYRQAFANFDIDVVAKFDETNVLALMQNANIVRHRLKIISVINNAQRIIELQNEFGSFSAFVWRFVENEPIINHWQDIIEVPSETKISQSMSKTLKKRGFGFVGSRICYAFMQASGLVDDHLVTCICRKQKDLR